MKKMFLVVICAFCILTACNKNAEPSKNVSNVSKRPGEPQSAISGDVEFEITAEFDRYVIGDKISVTAKATNIGENIIYTVDGTCSVPIDIEPKKIDSELARKLNIYKTDLVTKILLTDDTDEIDVIIWFDNRSAAKKYLERNPSLLRARRRGTAEAVEVVQPRHRRPTPVTTTPGLMGHPFRARRGAGGLDAFH